MNRRSFLARVGAALCGAMIATFPDFGVATNPNDEIRRDFMEVIRRFEKFQNTPGVPLGWERPKVVHIFFSSMETVRFDFN